MTRDRHFIATLCAVLVLAAGALVVARQLPSEPPRQFGTSITGAFEGWFYDRDGSRFFLVGYLNRNMSQALDVPVGPNNRIEPGGPDLGQPTHFLPGRNTGVLVIKVPKDFTPQDRLTWTIVANGQPMVIPLRLHTDYNVNPFSDVAVGNTPPVVQFDEKGPEIQGPVMTLDRAVTRTAALGTPLSITAWMSDDAKYSSGSNAPQLKPPPPVQLNWSKYRGPGTVTFDMATPKTEVLEGGNVNEPFRGKATVNVSFSEPGDYVLYVAVNDYSGEGGGGEVCCWTNGLVKVSVTP